MAIVTFRRSCWTKILLLFAFLCRLAIPQADAQPGGTEILWDNYGVPHVFGRNLTEMYYAFGYAQMQNHANLIIRLYGQSRGKAAEYWGKNFLSSDELIQLFNVPALAEQAYNSQDLVFKGYIDAFAKGLNAYVLEHPKSIRGDNKNVLPLMPQDVLAHCIRVLYLQFMAGTEIGTTLQQIKPGSNSIAIAPSRSASRHAMLMANPHLVWGDFFTFFEAHLQAPGFNAYGVSLVGLPVLNIAFNDHLGWTHTVNTIDPVDRYELTLQGDGYMLDGAVIPFETKSVNIKVRLTDGTYEDQAVTLRYSKQGPVLGTKGNKKAYAIRIAGMENFKILEQWHQMANAQKWVQFEAALKMMQLPMFNVEYADDAGNILYLFDGDVPRRSMGDWRFWQGSIDGSKSKYIWHENHTYEELPKVFNPASGFVQNANDPPWNCTYPAVLDAKNFPPYMSPVEMQLRPQRSVNMIRKEKTISFDQLVDFKLNTGMEAADRFLGDLLKAAVQYPDSLVSAAADVLQRWDRSTDSASRGGVLFAKWFDKLDTGIFAKKWDPLHPVETPCGLNDPKKAAALLKIAAGEVIKDYDSLNVAWGNVYRFRLNDLDLPANGGPDKYGIYRTINYSQDWDKKYVAVAGDTYVAITEFGDKVKALVLLSYGNASQPGNKHVGDQLILLAGKKLRNALLTREDIEKNLESREVLDIEP